MIGLSVVDYILGEKGWKFSPSEETPGAIPDYINNAQYLSELYFKTEPKYEGGLVLKIFLIVRNFLLYCLAVNITI